MKREPALWPGAAVAAALLAISFFALQHWLEHGQLSDVPVYHHYADLMRGGAVPYRDFPVEYPPAALAAFLVPSYMTWSYATSFAVLMGVCGLGCLAAAAAALRALGADELRGTAALLLMGVSPLVLGSLFDTRFDLWPAFLAVAALAALLRERPLLAGGLAGLAFAAKLWPGALAPLGLVYLWRRRGGRAALAGAVAFCVVAAACFAPFAVLAPGGVRHSLTVQLTRPLQVESLGASVLMTAEHLGATPLSTETSHGSQNLTGHAATITADATTALEVLLVVSVWIGFARRGRLTPDSVPVAAAAVVAVLVAFGKVLSPQFLIWLVPFVPLVRGRRGLVASSLLLAALGLTQTWFPGDYWSLALAHASPYSWYLLARDLALVALAGVLAWPRELEHEAIGEEGTRLRALESIRGL